jgi:hypothetical protein
MKANKPTVAGSRPILRRIFIFPPSLSREVREATLDVVVQGYPKREGAGVPALYTSGSLAVY